MQFNIRRLKNSVFIAKIAEDKAKMVPTPISSPEPKNAITKQYKSLFAMDGVELDFTKDALEAIAALSQERKTGARGLRAIMENVMMDYMFRIPSDMTIGKCIITKEAVDGTGEAKLEFRDAAVAAKKDRARRFERQNEKMNVVGK